MKTVLLSVLLLVAVPVAYPQSRPDADARAEASAQLRMLVQRASRQYMMYQYGVGGLAVSKEPLLATVTQVSDTLDRLAGEGGSARATSPEIRSQRKLVEEKWERLEKIFTYQPYKLFQAKELLPPAVRTQDPVLVRYVDRLTQELLAESDLLLDAYARHCEATGSSDCQSQVRATGTQMLLIETVSNDLMFTLLDVDRETRSEQLEDHAKQLQTSLELSTTPGHYGTASVLIDPVLETISSYWGQMKASVDQALDGNEDDVDIQQMLRAQQRLLEEIDNLTSILAGR